MDYSLYVLLNRSGRSYAGITALDPCKRLARHNRGEVLSTRKGRPWRIVAVEIYNGYAEARLREKQVKSWKGGNGMRKFLANVLWWK